jgi:hypothetical protein
MRVLRNKVFFRIVGGMGFLILLLFLIYYETFLGYLAGKIGPWEEEKLVGKPVKELTTLLDAKERFWTWQDPDIVYGHTGKLLGPEQRVLVFTKGARYRWFHYGTAINIGLAVVETRQDGDAVVDIFRSVEVDAS